MLKLAFLSTHSSRFVAYTWLCLFSCSWALGVLFSPFILALFDESTTWSNMKTYFLPSSSSVHLFSDSPWLFKNRKDIKFWEIKKLWLLPLCSIKKSTNTRRNGGRVSKDGSLWHLPLLYNRICLLDDVCYMEGQSVSYSVLESMFAYTFPGTAEAVCISCIWANNSESPGWLIHIINKN